MASTLAEQLSKSDIVVLVKTKLALVPRWWQENTSFAVKLGSFLLQPNILWHDKACCSASKRTCASTAGPAATLFHVSQRDMYCIMFDCNEDGATLTAPAMTVVPGIQLHNFGLGGCRLALGLGPAPTHAIGLFGKSPQAANWFQSDNIN